MLIMSVHDESQKRVEHITFNIYFLPKLLHIYIEIIP
jgi:hypothetical protein